MSKLGTALPQVVMMSVPKWTHNDWPQLVEKKTSVDPHADFFFWHSLRHSIWHGFQHSLCESRIGIWHMKSVLPFYMTCSAILSGRYSDMFLDILIFHPWHGIHGLRQWHSAIICYSYSCYILSLAYLLYLNAMDIIYFVSNRHLFLNARAVISLYSLTSGHSEDQLWLSSSNGRFGYSVQREALHIAGADGGVKSGEAMKSAEIMCDLMWLDLI